MVASDRPAAAAPFPRGLEQGAGLCVHSENRRGSRGRCPQPQPRAACGPGGGVEVVTQPLYRSAKQGGKANGKGIFCVGIFTRLFKIFILYAHILMDVLRQQLPF